jgi:cyclopropane fatty-acyl-phospholipid synthase-like methyltransferase
MGAVKVGEAPSQSIPGRMLPQLELSVPKSIVRYGYDEISEAYRGDFDVVADYEQWIDLLALPIGARVLDIGCGCGVPADRLLVDHGCEVLGVDVSDEQVRRARDLVPEARFERADIGAWDPGGARFDAIVSFYALIHVPRDDLRALVPRLATWLRPGGQLIATVGAVDWTAVEDYLGSPMFWDTTDPETTITWLEAAGFDIVDHRFVPEGDSGHELVHARLGQEQKR